MQPLVREYHDDDLEQVVHLFDVTAGQGSVFTIAECIGALRSDTPADGRDSGPPGATTADYLAALNEIHPTVTTEMVAAFEQDIAEFSRV